ncbi:MAG TPA: serine/threonine-protein kinase [Polyangia bacterium]|nr:serine/threonine-protein kinase [Polyangia bacterium]
MGTESLEIKPERFGRYVLLDRVGIGGMAEVFRAVMPGAQGFQRTFVVKRIISERAQSPYFVEMFVREARINAILHHPNIVQVFDFGEVGGAYFLAMEYVRGRDVSAIARRLRHRARPCPVGVAAFIAREVAQALGYAHALTSADGTPLNVVHRDVSPSNIICQRAGGVKLLDFGIAQALTEPEAEKTQRMFKGKIAYVAPERIKNQPADARADLFSLGVVLWELLAGRKLFRGKTEVETLQNVLEMPVPAPSSIRPDVPVELDQIVARALARDPAERYPNAYDLAEDLDGVLTALRYQSRALPTLLRELFGAELSSRQLPAASLTPELLASATATAMPTTTGTTPAPPSAAPDAPRAAPRIARRAPRSRWPWWVVAAVETATLMVLLFGRGGGRRTLARVAPPSVAAVPRAVQPQQPAPAAAAPPAPAAVDPTPAEPGKPASARPARRARSAGQGRIVRGLSINPFDEAASRLER